MQPTGRGGPQGRPGSQPPAGQINGSVDFVRCWLDSLQLICISLGRSTNLRARPGWKRSVPSAEPLREGPLFQTIGAYLDVLMVLGAGYAARYHAHRWVRKDGTPEEAERRLARTRKLGTGLLVCGAGLLALRILNV
jgi:hypothetical protein